MRALTQRDRRAVMLGTALIGAALLLSFGVLPALGAFNAARDALATERGRLSRERAVVAAAPATEASLRRAERTLAAFAHTAFDAAEPELATLQVARLVETIASLSGTPEARTAPLGIELDDEEVTQLRVRVTGEAQFEQLMLLLHRIETGPALLRIDQLSVRTEDSRSSGGADAEALLAYTITVNATGLADRAQLVANAEPPAQEQSTADAPSETALLAALIDDPFRPGVNVPRAAAQAEPVAAEPTEDTMARLAIVGTVVLPGNRGLVMATWGTEPPRLLRIGDRIGGLRLQRVERGAAEFEDEMGSKTVVRIPKPGV